MWRTEGLGVGEIIDVTDLDGDGETEVVFSPGSRLNTRYPAGAGPGELIVLAARDGAVLWRYAFAGVEFGLNRRRTTIVANADGRSKSIGESRRSERPGIARQSRARIRTLGRSCRLLYRGVEQTRATHGYRATSERSARSCRKRASRTGFYPRRRGQSAR